MNQKIMRPEDEPTGFAFPFETEDTIFHGLTKLEYFYAAALTGVCSNHILAQMFVEQAKSGIVGAQVNIPETLAKQAHAIATAAIQLLDNESKTGF